MVSWWLLAQCRDKNHLRCYCKYNLSNLHKPSHAQMRKFRMEAEKLLLQCIWAGYSCTLICCQTADAKLINIPTPNINQHYSDQKNALWSHLCLCCYSCLIGPIALIVTMLILWKCIVSILSLCLSFGTFHQCSFEPQKQPMSQFKCKLTAVSSI